MCGRTSADNYADQEDLIASLKRELTTARASHGDTKTLKAEITTIKAQTQEAAAENTRLATESKAHQASLAEARNEVKSLTAKLSAARESLKAAEAAVAAAKVQGSAVKAASQKNQANNAAPTGDMAILKLKEELYSDLTGLMVRAVKKVENEDVYDCIQTGRNGSKFHSPLLWKTSHMIIILTPVPRSTALPPIHSASPHQRGRHVELRRRGVRVHASPRREERQGTGRDPAGLPDRGDLLPAEQRGQVLC